MVLTYVLLAFSFVLIIGMLTLWRANRKLDKLYYEQIGKASDYAAAAVFQERRASRFKQKCLELTDENTGLTRALEQATIHQPPPTPGE